MVTPACTPWIFFFFGNRCCLGSVRLYCTLTDAQLTSQGQPLLGIICSSEIGALSSPPAFVLHIFLFGTWYYKHKFTHTHAHIHKHTHTHVSTNQLTFVHTYLHTNSLAGLLPWIEWRSRVSQVFLSILIIMDTLSHMHCMHTMHAMHMRKAVHYWTAKQY